VLPDSNKSIHEYGEVGTKFVSVGDANHQSKAFRTSPLVLADAKSIYADGEVGTKFVSVGDENQTKAFRSKHMALPNANKSIHGIDEVGTKFVSVGEDDQGKAFRSSALRMAGPKTILEANAGGSHFQARESGPHPQYYSGYISGSAKQYFTNDARVRKQ